jgi:hypothetical protein
LTKRLDYFCRAYGDDNSRHHARHIMPRHALKMVLRRDLPTKGIGWSRQHIARKIEKGQFPPPDGKTSDTPKAPNFWFEHTIDKYLRQRAAALRETRRTTSSSSSEPE